MKIKATRQTLFFLIFLYITILTTITGCNYLKISHRDDTITLLSYSQEKERTLTYNCAVIKGKIDSSDEIKYPTLLVAYPLSAKDAPITEYALLDSTNSFMLYLPEGHYHLYAIMDFNNDGVYRENEVSGIYGSLSSPKQISLVKEDLIKGILINTSRENSQKISFPHKINISESAETLSQLTYSGQVRKIYDEIFSPQNAAAGWWNPSVFMKAFGAHIYFVEEYNPNKIPVLFVHGAAGSPQNWVYFLMRLDRNRYQPWFFYYPSGIHLNLASRLLHDELVELRGKYGFNKMCLAAHSIGGLVTRSLLNRYKFDKDDDFIKLYVTFATPWSGFAAADASQKLQHKSLPSWGDIGEQSVFVRRTLNAKLPQNVKYYLFYGKEDKVSEGRALDDRALLDARESFGFDCGHSSILTDRDVFRRFSYILENEFYPHGKSRKIKR